MRCDFKAVNECVFRCYLLTVSQYFSIDWCASQLRFCLSIFRTCSDFIFVVGGSRKSSRMQQAIAPGPMRRYAATDASSTLAYRFVASQAIMDPNIAADLRPSADGSAVRTSLVAGLAVAVLKILNVIRDEAAYACTRSINSELFTGWQRRCGLSLPAPHQIVAVKCEHTPLLPLVSARPLL